MFRILLTLVAAVLIAGQSHAADWDIYGGSETVTNGDEYDTITLHNDATLIMSGGIVSRFNSHDTSSLSKSGGPTTWIYGYDTSTLELSGGYTSWVQGENQSVFTITGGSFFLLYALDSSVFNLYGYGFEYVPAGSATMLSGYWTDGTPFEFQLRRVQLPDEHYVLHEIPEPSLVLFLALGSLGLRRRTFRS